MASSSSSASTSAHKWKYEVFLSFRGEDTRDNFISHLYSALCRKLINTFIDDELIRGVGITPGLMEVIEVSKIGVIVFSKDYASSTFCLDEVAKMIECNEAYGQRVVPVFYHVAPSDVVNQTGSFAAAFAEHEIHNPDTVLRWKAALSKAANMAGWDSKVTRPESELVDKIVEDIFEKLNNECPGDLEGLVAMHTRINEMRNLLSKDSDDVRMLGFWGMGGIGKTTLAIAVFKHIARQFEGHCFLENVKETFARHGGCYVIKDLLSQISGRKDDYMSTSDILRSSIAKRMINKKVLIVADDVNTSQQLEFFKKNCAFLGKGSRILVTSRDKQALLSTVDDIYEVKKLGYSEALELFSQNAFKEDSPIGNYWDLSRRFIEYAEGNPLGLKVLGSSLYGKNQRVWKSALDKLKKAPNKEIQTVLKISYDSLDQDEKDIFLHVACFFRGERRDEATRILDACGFNTEIGLSVLEDKSLITISKRYDYGSLEMHGLLQEMGKEIVRQESKVPGQRSRLWDPEDIIEVLTQNTGTESIEAIFLDMSKINEIDLSPDVFRRMSRLKILKFSNGCEEGNSKVQFSQGLEYLPKEVRFLYWDGYPEETLPPNFHSVNLAELHLPFSKLKTPSRGDMNRKRLQIIDLQQSSCLVTVPELSLATNLIRINMYGCKNIDKFPSTIGLLSLETLNLTMCSKIETFPEVSSSIRLLDISCTAIKEVPESIGSLCKLEMFIVMNCTMIESLPSSICKLKSLEMLDLCGCSSLQQFPEILEAMYYFKHLYLDETSIKELPSSIANLKDLYWLRLEKCRELMSLPESLCNLTSLRGVNFSSCPKLKKVPANLIVSIGRNENHLTTSPSGLTNKNILDRCYLFPDLSSLSSVESMNLSHYRFETLSAGMEQFTRLRKLNISYCLRLQPLPKLPWRLRKFNANECRSLRRRYDSNVIIYTGNEIPEWFTYTSTANSIEIPLPNNCTDCRNRGFVATLCIVITSPNTYRPYPSECCIIQCHSPSGGTFSFEVVWPDSISPSSFEPAWACWDWVPGLSFVDSEIVASCYPIWLSCFRSSNNEFASLKFSIDDRSGTGLKVTKCGIRLLCTCPAQSREMHYSTFK